MKTLEDSKNSRHLSSPRASADSCSGWCWLQVRNFKLEISDTANGENPLIDGAMPVLSCDVWEHSYYIDYRNRRQDYLAAFLEELVNLGVR